MPSRCSTKKKRTQCKKPCTWRKGTYKNGKRLRKPSCAKPPKKTKKTTKTRTYKPSKNASACAKKMLKKKCSKPCTWRKRSTKNGKVVRRGSCAKPKSVKKLSMIEQLMKRSQTKSKSACNKVELKKDCKGPDCQWRKGSYKNGKRVRKGYCATNSQKKKVAPCPILKKVPDPPPILRLTNRMPIAPVAGGALIIRA